MAIDNEDVGLSAGLAPLVALMRPSPAEAQAAQLDRPALLGAYAIQRQGQVAQARRDSQAASQTATQLALMRMQQARLNALLQHGGNEAVLSRMPNSTEFLKMIMPEVANTMEPYGDMMSQANRDLLLSRIFANRQRGAGSGNKDDTIKQSEYITKPDGTFARRDTTTRVPKGSTGIVPNNNKFGEIQKRAQAAGVQVQPNPDGKTYTWRAPDGRTGTAPIE